MYGSVSKSWLVYWAIVCSCIHIADLRRLRSVDADPNKPSNSINSGAEYIWSTTTVALGDTAVLHCSFDAIFQQLRTGSIDWVKESTSSKNGETSSADETKVVKIASGKQLAISDRRYRVYRPHNSALSVLIVRRTRKQDAGVYRCNLAGSSTRHKYMVLNVTESKIEAQTSPNKMVAKAGADVALWCNATGYPKPVVYWTREDRNRKLPDGNQQFWGNELYFEKASETDTGIYTCYVDNFVQPVVSYKFSLMVEDNPWNVDGSKMRFDSSQWYPQDSPDPRPVRGRSFLLLCETRGSPQPLPSIAWYRDGRPLRNSKHFYIIEDSPEWRTSYTSSTLVIMRFRPDYQGNYTCVASNAFRMKKQTFQLSDMEENSDTQAGTSPSSSKPQKQGKKTTNSLSNPSNEKSGKTEIPSSRLSGPTTQTDDRRPTSIRGDVIKLVGLPGLNATDVGVGRGGKDPVPRHKGTPIETVSVIGGGLAKTSSLEYDDDEDNGASGDDWRR